MIREELFGGFYLHCDVIPMGKDYTLAVYGGDTPHVGSVVMSVARPSLTGEGTGVTSSVLTGVGHKDDVVAKIFAETVAKKKIVRWSVLVGSMWITWRLRRLIL